MRFSIFLCFFLRIRFRRFLISEPIGAGEATRPSDGGGRRTPGQDEGMPGSAMQARRISTITTLGAFSQFRRRSLFAREGFKAYGAVPLIVGGKLMGVLEVFHRSVLEPDREWLEFLDALATDAALAIEHASLQQNARDSRAPAGPKSASPAVSSLDREILGHVVEGLSNRAIAEKVHLSSHTVKFHLGQMLSRSGATNRTELSRKATREGWI